ncbi:hypothetical protein FKM82_005470 [Ascaphus truei]
MELNALQRQGYSGQLHFKVNFKVSFRLPALPWIPLETLNKQSRLANLKPSSSLPCSFLQVGSGELLRSHCLLRSVCCAALKTHLCPAE